MRFLNGFLVTVLSLVSVDVFAYEYKAFYIDPSVTVGHNIAQGNHMMVGLDLGYGFEEQIAIGLGAHYSAGEHPTHDRQVGAGPFAAYLQPVTPFLIAQIREDVNYVDQRILVIEESGFGENFTHINGYGVISATTLAVHLSLFPGLGVSGGYRLVKSLTNSDIAQDRSGPFLGVALGI